MGTGYVRQDVSDNIAAGKVIDATDFDNEFDALEAGFDGSSGHTHDGSPAEGGPISVVGPAQDFVAEAARFAPKADNTYDLGSATNGWRDLHVKRNATVSGDFNVAGNLGSDLVQSVVDLIYPVGSTIMESTGTNPGTRYTWQTWVAEAQGRAIVGVGEADGETWTGGQTKGTSKHTLTTGELPIHSHAAGSLEASELPLRSQFTTFTGLSNGASLVQSAININGWKTPETILLSTNKVDNAIQLTATTQNTRTSRYLFDHDHGHSVSGSTSTAGSGQGHNNIQPSKAFYIWRRTA